MATFLRIDGDTWRLPSTVNAAQIHAQISKAMQEGGLISIPVEMADDPRGQTSLTINGRAAAHFALVEIAG
jgi:hypothetical protein